MAKDVQYNSKEIAEQIGAQFVPNGYVPNFEWLDITEAKSPVRLPSIYLRNMEDVQKDKRLVFFDRDPRGSSRDSAEIFGDGQGRIMEPQLDIESRDQQYMRMFRHDRDYIPLFIAGKLFDSEKTGGQLISGGAYPIFVEYNKKRHRLPGIVGTSLPERLERKRNATNHQLSPHEDYNSLPGDFEMVDVYTGIEQIVLPPCYRDFGNEKPLILEATTIPVVEAKRHDTGEQYTSVRKNASHLENAVILNSPFTIDYRNGMVKGGHQ